MPKGHPLPPLQAGEVFGRLTVLREGAPRHYAGKITRSMRCRCECGNETEVMVSALRRGLTTSCGCFWRERITKHGKATSRVYSIWEHMIQRGSPHHADAKHYHNRGIRVCERWKTFENFYADMGDPPHGMELDRYPDNNGNYEPGNCRWATRKQQMHNVRTNVWITLPGGVPAVLSEACRLTGVSIRSVTDKVGRGATHQEAFDHYLQRLLQDLRAEGHGGAPQQATSPHPLRIN